MPIIDIDYALLSVSGRDPRSRPDQPGNRKRDSGGYHRPQRLGQDDSPETPQRFAAASIGHRQDRRRDGGEDLRRARRLVGMIFQDADSQIVGETVAADVAFGPENLSLPAAEVGARDEAALQTVGLTTLADQTPQALSGGEKRRLSIAGVLAMHPQIVVFDEPFAGLDYPGTRQVLREMLRLQEAGHTLVVATHDLEKIIHHADRLIVMNGGRVVKDGPRPHRRRDRVLRRAGAVRVPARSGGRVVAHLNTTSRTIRRQPTSRAGCPLQIYRLCDHVWRY